MNKIYQKTCLPLKTAGFTLIELLVVVLIIGMLAAVALPQYRVSVYKARYVQLQTAAKALWDAQTRYHLANGSYTLALADLDISFAGKINGGSITAPNLYCALARSDADTLTYIMCTNDKNTHMIGINGVHSCLAYHGDKAAEQACLSFGAVQTSARGDCDGTCKVYEFK